MQALAERARQALGLGSESFVGSSLEAQTTTLQGLEVVRAPLQQLLAATEAFRDDTKGFLDACGSYLTDAPMPRLWLQASPHEPAVPADLPVPAAHAALFDGEVHASFAEAIPGTVGRAAVDKELVAPIKQWLLAMDVAKARLSSLEGRRLQYDATRRGLVNEAARAAAAADKAAARHDDSSTSSRPAPTVATASVQQPQEPGSGTTGDEGSPAAASAEVVVVTGGVELAQLQEDAAAKTVFLSEYERDVEALTDALDWLASGAARLKALLADSSGSLAAAALAWSVPHDLMPPLPETTVIAPDVEVTVSVSEAPLGALTGGEDASASVRSATAGGSSSSSSATGGTTSPRARPPPDLSRVLPSDEMVFGGGVAPSPSELSAQPAGGGVAALIADTVRPPQATAEAATAAADDDGDTTAAAEVAERPPHPYSGEGRGQRESRLTDEAAALGLGRAQRQMSSSLSQHEAAVAAAAAGVPSGGTGLAARPQVQVPDADKKQLSTVVLPSGTGGLTAASPAAPAEPTAASAPPAASASPAAAAQVVDVHAVVDPAESFAAAPSADDSAAAGGSTAAGAAAPQQHSAEDTAAAGRAAATSSSSGSSTQAHQQQQWEGTAARQGGGGLMSAIARTLQDAASDVSGQLHAAAGAISHGSHGASGTQPSQQPEPLSEEQQAGGSDSSAGEDAAATGAVWFKGPTRPGGAAAGGVAGSSGGGPGNAAAAAAAQEESAADARELASQGAAMHVGPVPAVSADEPGAGPVGATWIKGPTAPGGAAATAGTTGPAAGDAGPLGSAAAAVAASPAGPDLSKILPSYDQLPASSSARPAGGGVGAFLRDTLLGPAAERQ